MESVQNELDSVTMTDELVLVVELPRTLGSAPTEYENLVEETVSEEPESMLEVLDSIFEVDTVELARGLVPVREIDSMLEVEIVQNTTLDSVFATVAEDSALKVAEELDSVLESVLEVGEPLDSMVCVKDI